MQLDIKPASDYPVTDLFRFLNLSFENYLIPIQFNINQFLGMLRKDGIDLNTSRVLLVDDEPSGTALIARRGWTSRLAAMGVMKEARGKKAGSWLMEQLIKEARARNDREMTLEVIEQNEPAVRLYKRSNFQTIRRLIGFAENEKSPNTVRPASHLQEMDLREMGRLILQHGLPDLPWQFSGETIALLNPPARAYRNGQAYIAISDPTTENVVIWSLLVETAARGQGLAAEMLQDVMVTFPNKQWHVPAILPEELGFVFERAGFQREELSQWQMRLML